MKMTEISITKVRMAMLHIQNGWMQKTRGAGNPHSLWIGFQTGIASAETSMENSQTLNIKLSQNPTL